MDWTFEIIRGLSVLTVIGQGIAAGTLIGLLVAKRSPLWKRIAEHSLFLALVVTTVATAGSLFFSEIAHYVPCTLCWFQRAFMYPLVPFFALALVKHPTGKILSRYALVMSIFGAAIALYHYLLQMTHHPVVETLAPCTIGGVSCSQSEIMMFGYITIPLMALTGFVLVILLMALRTLTLNHAIP